MLDMEKLEVGVERSREFLSNYDWYSCWQKGIKQLLGGAENIESLLFLGYIYIYIYIDIDNEETRNVPREDRSEARGFWSSWTFFIIGGPLFEWERGLDAFVLSGFLLYIWSHNVGSL
jgi:hypothetical protein